MIWPPNIFHTLLFRIEQRSKVSVCVREREYKSIPVFQIIHIVTSRLSETGWKPCTESSGTDSIYIYIYIYIYICICIYTVYIRKWNDNRTIIYIYWIFKNDINFQPIRNVGSKYFSVVLCYSYITVLLGWDIILRTNRWWNRYRLCGWQIERKGVS